MERILSGEFPDKIKQSQQNRHIEGTKEFDPTRSQLTQDPQRLIRKYEATSDPLVVEQTGEWKRRTRFVADSEIGIHKETGGVNPRPTKRGMIHYSKNGKHVVPTSPDWELR